MTVSTSLLILYPLLLVVLILYRAKYITGGQYSVAFMTLGQCRMIRGAACIGVMIHHLTQQITGYGSLWRGPVTIFSEAGYLFTAVFFFLSGYGLIVNVYERTDYLDHFLKRRLSAVLIPFWVINTMIVTVRMLTGLGIRHFREAVMYASGFLLVNSNAWFVVEIIILYLFFYLSFRFLKNKNTALIVLSAATFLLMYWSFTRGHDLPEAQVHWFRGEWWYNSTTAFVFGIWYARVRKRMDSLWMKSRAISGRRYAVILTAAAAGFSLIFYAAIRVNRRLGYYHSGPVGRNDSLITLLFQTAACLAFLILLLLLSRKLMLNSPVLTWIGGMGLELFLIHRPVMDLLPHSLLRKPFLWYAIVLAGSLIAGAVISPLTRGLSWMAGKRLERKPVQVHQVHSADTRIRYGKKQERRMNRAWILRRAIRIILPAAVLVGLCLTVGWNLMMSAKTRREYQALQNAKIGDRVLFGRFDTDLFFGKERLSWIVVNRKGGRLCLLCEKGIVGSFYHRKHEAVSWENSDLRELLNSDENLKAFSGAERKLIVPNGEDLVSLLTVQEANDFFQTDQQRELDVTEAAKARGTNSNRLSKANNWDMKGYRSSWWWLRGEDGQEEITAPIVTVDGTIAEHEKYVNKPGGAVRPVIWVSVDLGT